MIRLPTTNGPIWVNPKNIAFVEPHTEFIKPTPSKDFAEGQPHVICKVHFVSSGQYWKEVQLTALEVVGLFWIWNNNPDAFDENGEVDLEVLKK